MGSASIQLSSFHLHKLQHTSSHLELCETGEVSTPQPHHPGASTPRRPPGHHTLRGGKAGLAPDEPAAACA